RRRRGLDEIGVVADRDRAPVVAHPVAARVLHVARDRVEVLVLVLREQTLGRAGDRESGTVVDGVGGARISLERLDGLVLFRRAAVRVRVRDLDAVLLLERRHHLAVVRPVWGQGDRVEVTFLLRGLDEIGQTLRRHGRRRAREAGAGRAEGGARAAENGEAERGGGAATQHRRPAQPLLLELRPELDLLGLVVLHAVPSRGRGLTRRSRIPAPFQ